MEEMIEYQCNTHGERTFQDGEEQFIYGRDEDEEKEPHHKPFHIWKCVIVQEKWFGKLSDSEDKVEQTEQTVRSVVSEIK